MIPSNDQMKEEMGDEVKAVVDAIYNAPSVYDLVRKDSKIKEAFAKAATPNKGETPPNAAVRKKLRAKRKRPPT